MPRGRSTGEHRDRGSRFLAVAGPCGSPEEAREAQSAERRRHHDATHHVFGWRSAGGEERWDDDGEPAGTGGRPALGAIEAAGVRDVVVVITRWFGGTKLGTGGLARAYAAAAEEALRQLPTARVRPGRLVRLRYAWEDTGIVAATLDARGAHRVAERYGNGPEIDVSVPEAEAAELVLALRDASGGRIVAELVPGAIRVRVPS